MARTSASYSTNKLIPHRKAPYHRFSHRLAASVGAILPADPRDFNSADPARSQQPPQRRSSWGSRGSRRTYLPHTPLALVARASGRAVARELFLGDEEPLGGNRFGEAGGGLSSSPQGQLET